MLTEQKLATKPKKEPAISSCANSRYHHHHHSSQPDVKPMLDSIDVGFTMDSLVISPSGQNYGPRTAHGTSYSYHCSQYGADEILPVTTSSQHHQFLSGSSVGASHRHPTWYSNDASSISNTELYDSAITNSNCQLGFRNVPHSYYPDHQESLVKY